MTEENTPEPIRLELEIKLTNILHEPIQLQDGSILSEGDYVQHPKYGKGKVIRISNSDEVGNLVYADFEDGNDRIVGANFIKKLQS